MRQVYLTAQTKHAWWMLANFAKVHDITKCGAYKWITWRLLNIFELKRLFRRNSHMVSVERATICSGCVLFLTSVILWHWYASSDVPLYFPLPLLLQEKRSGAFDFWEGLTVQKLTASWISLIYEVLFAFFLRKNTFILLPSIDQIINCAISTSGRATVIDCDVRKWMRSRRFRTICVVS